MFYFWSVTVSLEKISRQLSAHGANSANKYPPVELWDPPFCGEIDIQIKTDGSWFYNGSEIKRKPLVKLFASVLKKEADEYYLVTPVEKVKIKVDDAPLVITQWCWLEDHESMELSTNLDDVFTLDKGHPLTVSDDGSLYVIVRRNLKAKVHRNVYYQWIELAEEVTTERGVELVFTSSGQQFSLGIIG